MTSEARAQTGQAWLPEQRREPASASQGVNTGLGSDTGRDENTGPSASTGLNASAGPGAKAHQAAGTGRRTEVPPPGRHRRRQKHERPTARSSPSASSALMPDVLPGDKFVVGSAVGNITFQASQILGFVAGAAVVAILDPHKTLAIDAGTFGLSALITGVGVRPRPAPARDGAGRTSLWSASTDGIRLVLGSRLLLTLLLFGWLAGFYIVPEGLAAPYARPCTAAR